MKNFFVAHKVKNLPVVWETWIWSLGLEDPSEKETAIHSSILAWIIPWTEEPGRLQSMGSLKELDTTEQLIYIYICSMRLLLSLDLRHYSPYNDQRYIFNSHHLFTSLAYQSWRWTGRPGVLRFMGSRRVGYNWATELNWTCISSGEIHPSNATSFS